MKKFVAIFAFSMLVLPPVALAGKGQPKVPVCHFGFDEVLLVDTMKIIVISNKAVARHLANHSNSLGSDHIVADEICGNGFDEDCNGADAVCP